MTGPSPGSRSTDVHAGGVASRLLRSTFFAGITSFADLLLLVLLIVAGRLLGTEDFGRLAFGLAMSSVIAFLINFGLDSVSIRHIAVNRNESNAVLGSVLGGKLLLALTGLALYMLAVRIMVDDPLTRNVTNVLGFAGVLRSINLTLRAFLHGHERFREESIVVLIERLLVLVLGAALLYLTGDLVSFVLAFPIARVIGFALLIAQLHRVVPSSGWSFDPALVVSLLRQGLPLGVAIVSFGVYGQIDVLLLAALLTPADVGEFAAASRLFEGVLIVPSILTIVVYPRMAMLAAADPAKHRELFLRSVKYLAIFAAPLLVAGTLLSGRIIEFLYGSNFAPSAAVLSLLAAAVLFLFVHASVDTALRSLALEKAVMRVNVVSLAAKLALGLLLIPQMGIIGAAVAGVGGALVMLASGLSALGWQWLSPQKLVPVLAKTATAAAAMALCIAFLHEWSLPALLIASLIVYGVVLLAARILDQREWTAVVGLVRSKS